MRYTITFCLTLLLQQISYGQADTIFYFSQNGSPCSKEQAKVFRRIKLVDSETQRYFFEEYAMDSTLKSKGYYLSGDFALKIGSYVEYYENGNRKLKGTFFSDVGKNVRGQKINTWFYWYENGSVQQEKLYALDTTTNSYKSFVVSFWDTSGLKKVKEGEGDYSFTEKYFLTQELTQEITFTGSVKEGLLDGKWKGFYQNGTLFCEETYNDGALTEGKSYDTWRKGYTYNKIEDNPEFRGGDGELIRFLQKNIVYPWNERNEDIQGKVMVRFVVDELGKVMRAEVTHSVSPGLDKEALRVVNMLPDFKPGMIRGQPVSVNVNLPVVFKLR